MLFAKKKVLIAGILFLGAVLIGLILFLVFKPQRQTLPQVKPANLSFWGAFDDSDVIAPLMRDLHEAYPTLSGTYKKFAIEEYESALLNAFATGKGPDVFMINNTWVPRYLDKIAPAPPLSIDERTFRDSYVDVAVDDLLIDGKIYGIPLHVDTLALFYNRDLLASSGIAKPPATWEEFLAAAEKLTKRDARGNVVRAGAALGTARNVNRSFDILSLLMLQQGTKMVDDARTRALFDSTMLAKNETFVPGERALTFYTDFANPRKRVYTWNALQHFSIDAFIAGEAAMMINYARTIPLVESRAPYLKWSIAALPQISERDFDVNYANYWALVVAASSKNISQGWQLADFMGSRDVAKKYLDATRRPTARRDLVDIQRTDPKLGVFAVQALSAKSWYQVDNVQIENIFADMIDSVVRGADTAKEAVTKAARQVGALMRK